MSVRIHPHRADKSAPTADEVISCSFLNSFSYFKQNLKRLHSENLKIQSSRKYKP